MYFQAYYYLPNHCLAKCQPLTIVSLRHHGHEVVGILLELDVLYPLVEQDGLADELLQLTVGEDGQLGHDLLRLPRPEVDQIYFLFQS